MNVLIFPSSVDESVRLAADARRSGDVVIGSSSLAVDPNAAFFDRWEHLPYLGEQDFLTKLCELIEREGIQEIATPHSPTYLALEQSLPRILPGVSLRGTSPYGAQMERVSRANAEGARCALIVDGIADKENSIPVGLLSAILAQADQIHGECTKEKLLAICGIFSDSPRGDVIEIGSLFGKSAYVLNRLATHFGVGATLAVDPWDMETSVQKDSSVLIQQYTRVWDWNRIFDGFLLTMQACCCGDFNYIRASSMSAYGQYDGGAVVVSEQFGRTELAGSIAILHIDGNHDESAVRLDFDLWAQKLAPGGWIIFDDYEWTHGDGPKVVADEVVGKYAGFVERKFVAGGALFVKMSSTG
ncbi:class I SAM-dependent methyltransferase [Tardiphaga sp. OK245]|uniref:class I SAM-dependent methyltransferase n=1 Tax=Tardiphaga sp. OK245 TaxID=1855306 RepID=UPI0008A795C5|nr:class I SAM-dependent methyltransferase [Tardiphaga sp. OK245]SEI18972.1 Methyltransferase domain-containing protein [Tardiphaga sp. OK245]